MTHLASNTHHCANMTSLSTPVANLDSVTVLSYFFKASCPRGSVTSGYMRLWKLSRAHRSLKGWDQWLPTCWPCRVSALKMFTVTFMTDEDVYHFNVLRSRFNCTFITLIVDVLVQIYFHQHFLTSL